MRRYLILATALVAATAAAAADNGSRVAPMVARFTDQKDHWIVSVWKDPDTGCEYLVTLDHMTPRLDHDGRPRCPT